MQLWKLWNMNVKQISGVLGIIKIIKKNSWQRKLYKYPPFLNGSQHADDNLKCIFGNQNLRILTAFLVIISYLGLMI